MFGCVDADTDISGSDYLIPDAALHIFGLCCALGVRNIVDAASFVAGNILGDMRPTGSKRNGPRSVNRRRNYQLGMMSSISGQL